MITISIKHLFAILELRGKEAENTVGHSWPYCRAYRVVCQKTLDATVHMVTVGHIAEHTEWSAKGLLGQKPPCFLHQNFLPSSQLGRAASPIVVILKNMSTSIHGNAIKRTTSNSQQASSHTCPLSETSQELRMLSRSFQLLEYQWSEGKFDKQTSSDPTRRFRQFYDWGNLNGSSSY